MSKKNQQRMTRIRDLITPEPARVTLRPAFLRSIRDSPEHSELRELLLAIHKDAQLAQFLRSKFPEPSRNLGSFRLLYDPEPNGFQNYYLAWKGEGRNIIYAYVKSGFVTSQSIFPDEKPIPYRLVKSRFYALVPGLESTYEELIDKFPKLTASELEECVERRLCLDRKRYQEV